ncbi:MAG TPA: sulfatase [Flavobacteriales bacterium]|nr:sulfatase [Flavobacteriales bacterium]
MTCTKEHSDGPVNYQTKKVIILLVDGPRWEESGGDTSHEYMPYTYNDLAPQGTLFANFHNNGETYTIPGHTAILTGHYQSIANDGSQHPQYPGLLQLYLEKFPQAKALLIASKGKIACLRNCTDPVYAGQFMPEIDCGLDGTGGGVRDDSVTFEQLKTRMTGDHPDFIFVQFKEPDAAAHAGDTAAYINGIVNGDQYVFETWNLIQSLPYYQNKTMLVVTNDHGRHLNGTLDGFISHGDGCAGCRRINCLLLGPDVKAGKIITNTYDQTDIHATVCGMLGLNNQYGQGQMILEALVY